MTPGALDAASGADGDYLRQAQDSIPALTAAIRSVRPAAAVGELIGVGITGPVVAVDDPEWGAAVAKGAVSPGFPLADRRAIVVAEAAKLDRAAGPHTLRLLAAYPDAPVPFLVTERLPVPSLREQLRADSALLPVTEASALLLGVASALASCHAAGLVHLDVKPSNVGISANGRATLMDFGLARAARAALVHKLPAGTLPYSAPELVRTGEVGPHTDVWGWGLLAHIVLTGGRYPGRRPATWGDLFRRGAVVPPPIGQRRPQVPAEVADVIDRSVAVDTVARPQDGGHLFDQLEAGAVAAWGCEWAEPLRFRFAGLRSVP